MKNYSTLLGILLFAFASCSERKEPDTSLLKYVDITIGTIKSNTLAARQAPPQNDGYAQTIPAITAPFGMTQWTPANRMTEENCQVPYFGDHDLVYGFRASHWTNGSCAQDYGSFTFMPVAGYFDHRPVLRAAKLIYEAEVTTPAYGLYHLPEFMVIAEATATQRCGFFRFSYADPTNAGLVFDINSDEGLGYFKIDPERREIIAANPVHKIFAGSGEAAGFSGYLVMQFDTDFKEFGTYSDSEINSMRSEISDMPRMGGFVLFDASEEKIVNVKIGTSFTSIEKARENLEAEIPDWDIQRVKAELEQEWESLLGTIKVDSQSEEHKITFYSALYRSLLHPRLYSDADGTYLGFGEDKQVYKAEGFDYYCDFYAYDTFRAQMPLLSLVAPKAYQDMITSLIKKAEQGGWLPSHPMWNSYTAAFLGDPTIAIIGDAFMKGFPVDMETAWPFLRQHAFETPDSHSDYVKGKGRRALQTYLQLGYLPLEEEIWEAPERHQQVARTLEYAYSDWVLSRIAGKLGHTYEETVLAERALNYANVFDYERGWVNGRYADGSFNNDFNASRKMSWLGDATPAQYTWSVLHDLEGLMELMDGKSAFIDKLLPIIENRQFWHGNSANQHLPYLFNYVDRWDLTQKSVKYVLSSFYSASKDGLTDKDKAGQLSAWYVFSAIGFYPVTPGANEYQLSSPIFDKVTLQLDKNYYPGAVFSISAPQSDALTVFETVQLNGKQHGFSLRHEDLQNGGNLVFAK